MSDDLGPAVLQGYALGLAAGLVTLVVGLFVSWALVVAGALGAAICLLFGLLTLAMMKS